MNIQRYCRDTSGNLVTENYGDLVFFKDLEREVKQVKKILDIKKLAKKYFKLTGRSPQYSFWAFLDATGTEPTNEGLEELYNELDDYFPKKES